MAHLYHIEKPRFNNKSSGVSLRITAERCTLPSAVLPAHTLIMFGQKEPDWVE
jgi:hypothetical protein